MGMDRRSFLRGAVTLGAATAVGACAPGGGGRTAAPSSTSHTATTAPARPATARGALVVITLDGGNDALNTVVPVLDGRYRAARGALALNPSGTHDIGEGFALHPALARCKGLWDDGRLAVVHGVGFASLDRSHFRCRDVWHAGDEHDLDTGWLGRWLDRTSEDPLTGVAVGRRLPLSLRGATTTGAVLPTGPVQPLGGAPTEGDPVGGASDPDAPSALAAAAARADADLLAVIDRVAPVTAGLVGGDGLAAALETAGALLAAELPTRVVAVQLDGFDTHADQPGQHQALLGELDAALGDFLDAKGERPVTVLIHSEFGRRVAPNASAGTDHGRAGTVLVAGTVVPGHHGEPPPLDRLVDGDLATTVDFRSVYGGLLEGVLGTEAGDVLPDAVRPLTLV